MAADADAGPLVALLIENNPADARRIARRLTPTRRVGIACAVELVHVSSVASARAALGSSAIDVVLLDLCTTDAPALEELHQLRSAAPDLPVIVLTDDEAIACAALRAGALDYVCKPPPDGATLRRTLHRVREQYCTLRDLAAARRAAAARDRAVGIVSHDIHNSLGAIQICAAALLDPEPPSESGVRHMARIIQRASAWMQQIAQDLLDHMSLDAGCLALDSKPTPVSEVIGAANAMFAPLAEERALELVVESATNLPMVDVDPRRLLQVLSNLLGNALKFTPAGGRVVLSACAADEATWGAGARPRAVRFQVSDTGPGISPEDLPHVCDWFWQAEHRTRDGAGLGLAIAKGLVEAHGGRLSVESVPGHGSSFWFTLPAVRRRRRYRPATGASGAITSPALL